MTYSNLDCQETDMSRGRREAAWLAARNAQADAHVNAYRRFVAAYGNLEGYYLHKARQARTTAQMMEAPSGRAWIAKQNAAHAEWRANR